MTNIQPFRLPVVIEPGTGPFRDGLSFDLIAGANLLKWENGVGKSTAMRLIGLFAKQRLSVGDLTVTDDLTGMTAEIRVGAASIRARQGQKPKAIGRETLPPIEGLPDVIRVLATGDHRKGTRPAFKARLGALLAWVGLGSDADLIDLLIGRDAAVREACRGLAAPGDDLVEAAEEIRKGIYGLTRTAAEALQAQSDRHNILAGRKAEALGTFPEDEISRIVPEVEASELRHSKLLQELGSIQARRESALAEESRRSQLRDGLGDRPGTLAEEGALALATTRVSEAKKLEDAQRERLAGLSREEDLEERVAEAGLRLSRKKWESDCRAVATILDDSIAYTGDTLKRALDNTHESGAALLATYQGMKEPLARQQEVAAERAAVLSNLQEAMKAREKAVADQSAADQALRAAQERQARWDRVKAEISQPISIPSEESVTEAEEKVRIAANLLAAHRAAVKYREIMAKMAQSQEAMVELKDRVDFLEAEPNQVWSRLAQAVNLRLKSDLIRVEGEEIQIKATGDEWRDIADTDRVSEGIRHAVCYDLLLAHRVGSRVILIEDSTAVGPARLEELGAKARESGVILVLETPIGAVKGFYAVEHFPKEG